MVLGIYLSMTMEEFQVSVWEKRKKKDLDITTFNCSRLKENRNHKTLIQGFNSNRNSSLSWYLKHNAWIEDENNYRAYYLVKDKNKIVLYFSLQNGMLIQCHQKILKGVSHRESDSKTDYFIDEDKIDVTNVIPGIELSHFCVNDSYRRRKNSWKVTIGLKEYTVGAYVFYKFIAPKIAEVALISGVQYVYLFCADEGSNKLIEYYRDELHFSVMDDMACLRPKYDNGTSCCMTIKIKELIDDTYRFQDIEKVPAVLEYIQYNRTISIEQARKNLDIFDPLLLFDHIVKVGGACAVSTSSSGKIVKIGKLPKVRI